MGHLRNEFLQLFVETYRTTQKMKFSINDFFSKCDQIRKDNQVFQFVKFIKMRHVRTYTIFQDLLPYIKKPYVRKHVGNLLM